MKTTIPSLLELRILVLALGESHHAGWWKSQFLSPIGLSYLERIYPRSTFAAAVSSACRVAQSVHDANIGKGAVFHLFRLPRQIEREVKTSLSEQSAELSAHYQPLIAAREALLKRLGAMAAEPLAQAPVGPVRISAKDNGLVPAWAAAYLTAFQTGGQVFPYFEAE